MMTRLIRSGTNGKPLLVMRPVSVQHLLTSVSGVRTRPMPSDRSAEGVVSPMSRTISLPNYIVSDLRGLQGRIDQIERDQTSGWLFQGRHKDALQRVITALITDGPLVEPLVTARVSAIKEPA